MLRCPPAPPAPTALRGPRGRLGSERGQSLVEFAVILPVLLLVVFGVLYFGRYESYSTQMTQLASQGARAASVNFTPPSSMSIASYIAGQASGELHAGSASASQVLVKVDCAGTTGCVTTAGTNTVTVCLQSRVQFPALNIAAGTIYQQATMQVETQGSTPLQDSVFPTGSTAAQALSC